MPVQTALIIDDEPDIRELISITISRLGFECHSAANLNDARHVLEEFSIDVCLTDMRLPDGNGIDFVKYMQDTYPDIPVAVITAHGNMDAAVNAMKNGAFDFVSKPVNLKLLRKLITSATATLPSKAKNTSQNQEKSNSVAPPHSSLDSRLLGNSAPMQTLKRLILKLAKSQAPVLINGESGTGKELVARLIHDSGPRADKPFIPINCGAIPSELVESEFFGHKKGSFTGATEDKIGLFQAAEDGTLFLDEVAELPLFMQVKLLRVIQEKAVKVVGTTQEIAINVRIISASYKNLEQEVEAERFRHDLFYRLNVIDIKVPALRERPEDIDLLVTHILQRLAVSAGEKKAFPISSCALSALKRHSFTGNVRELENILERATTLAENSELGPDDLLLPTPTSTNNLDEQTLTSSTNSLKDIETSKILETLEKTQWNRKEAAALLGLSYRQLRYKLQKIEGG
jgi:two-component system response regulator PilR (NtrC family)